MQRKTLIAGGVLALTLAALLAVPAWLGAGEPETTPDAGQERPARGFLGVELRPLTPELQAHFGAPEGRGVLVAGVSDEGPAAAAGIRVGDVITAVDGLGVDSPRELAREVRHRPGEEVSIELYRDREPRQLTATLGRRQARHWRHGGRSDEEWAELAERWGRWGEEFGERMGRWGEEFGQRWGEEFAERWGEEHAERWERWAEEMAERGEGWEEMGEEVSRTVEKMLAEIDWDEIGRAVERAMKAVEETNWEEMGERIERRLEELERRLEERREKETGSD